MRIALAQINVVVGDLAGNRHHMMERYTRARQAGADNLGISLHTIPIAEILDRFDQALTPVEGWHHHQSLWQGPPSAHHQSLPPPLNGVIGNIVNPPGAHRAEPS